MNKSVRKWRENNKEKYNDYIKGQMVIYRKRHKETVNSKRMKTYYWSKISQTFLQILMDDPKN